MCAKIPREWFFMVLPVKLLSIAINTRYIGGFIYQNITVKHILSSYGLWIEPIVDLKYEKFSNVGIYQAQSHYFYKNPTLLSSYLLQFHTNFLETFLKLPDTTK